MRFATYNIWNSEMVMPSRTYQLIEEIECINADVLCLQEVKNEDYHNKLVNLSKYSYACFFHHDNEDEGLSVLSRYPLKDQLHMSRSIIVTLSAENHLVALANIHLTWNSALKRECEIVDVEKTISIKNADYKLILGDYNCSPHSSVQEFLLGQRSLLEKEANPYWYDLAKSYAEKAGSTPEITLDFQNNPRWYGRNTIEVNQRVDRILLQNTYPNQFPYLVDCKTFGRTVSDETGFAPSDHYGVYVDLEFVSVGDKP